MVDSESSKTPPQNPPPAHPPEGNEPPRVNSLRELIDLVTGRNLPPEPPASSVGPAENYAFPFLALVGQEDMKLALMLALINPWLGGVLLIGPRGTGKTTAVRGLVDLLPETQHSACPYGCLPEDIEAGGIDAVCPDCARKYGQGLPLTVAERARLIELPPNARLEDVIGGLDEGAAPSSRPRLRPGILAQADQNILYIDEVNRVADEVLLAILNTAAQGHYSVPRGATSATYSARFTLIGSMDPEENSLRPQVMDHFGLRVIVRGLTDPAERLEAYHRARAYRTHSQGMAAQFEAETQLARQELQSARQLLSTVQIADNAAQAGMELIHRLGIDSLRAEITLFEAARAYAAADGRSRVSKNDVRTLARLALRLRPSKFMEDYMQERAAEDDRLATLVDEVIPNDQEDDPGPG